MKRSQLISQSTPNLWSKSTTLPCKLNKFLSKKFLYKLLLQNKLKVWLFGANFGNCQQKTKFLFSFLAQYQLWWSTYRCFRSEGSDNFHILFMRRIILYWCGLFYLFCDIWWAAVFVPIVSYRCWLQSWKSHWLRGVFSFCISSSCAAVSWSTFWISSWNRN